MFRLLTGYDRSGSVGKSGFVSKNLLYGRNISRQLSSGG
ncbi:hypothetical protein M083_1499 [Bacteroides fragilis str. 3986 T(B)9]|uniref:Uncharacterized protein n=1 Tax=Bacteroides fragilis TaxID=817 RepID=A0A853PV26_BACFG|nr:hypothetical protein M117_1390 [Bacteroides fragilis str. 3774 T13]EXY60989.1 hypothetical protein M111_1359 [Bacteroides fragilis str. 3986T(B)10]EXY70625.1 hypothetical protein M083_1592 [Bacteroides fragilis str. 3986 T(B)9]EXZ79107.1 hypothetical protein M144_1571 [Bacteroides fragilis str. 3-F-2 \